MIQNSFAVRMNLRPGDVVVVPKSLFNMVEHYVVYWGIDADGVHFYLENNNVVGIRRVPESTFRHENPEHKRIRRFYGNDYARDLAIKRAESQLGQPYSMWKFNCENYANYVQYGVSSSRQVDNTVSSGLVLSIIAIIIGLSGNRR